MHLLVVMKMVPDVVEELEIAAGGQTLDLDAVRMISSESDDHALEEALLLKEKFGGHLTVLAIEAPELDDVLFTALAKGADRVLKVTGCDEPVSTGEAADILYQVIASRPELGAVDLILTGTQAIDDLDGLMAPLLAYRLGWPYLGILTLVAPEPGRRKVNVLKEYSGGLRAEFEMPLPAVLGIQAAEKPPRYVPVAKVRAAMKSMKIEPAMVPALADAGPPILEISRMDKAATAGRAELIEGSPEEVGDKLCAVLAGRGLL